MATKIADHYFEYNSLKYFRGNAHLVEIATFGEKKDPVGAEAYLDPQGKVKREYLTTRAKNGVTVTIDWASSSQASVEVDGKVKVFGIGASAAIDFSYSQLKSGNVKLMNVYILEGAMKSLLNNDATAARNFLKDEGSDARIVGELWIALDATLSKHFDTSTSVTFGVSAEAQLNVTASGGASGTQTISLSPGSTFAYKNYKVKDWNSDKTRIENLEADYYGNG